MKRPVTLKDIARETGVHVSTVSRALDPNGRTVLTEEVVERVRAAAARMGYRHNRLASGLRTKRTMTIGMIIPDITNTLFPSIVRGAESVLEPLGYASIIVNTDSLPEREDKLIDVLQERGVDGIIHAAVQRSDPKIVEVVAGGLPVITVNRKVEGASIPCVVNDDAGGIGLAVEHLHSLGHRRIAHIAGPKTSSTGAARLQAFREWMANLGLEVPPQAIVQATRYDEDEGRSCVAALASGGWPLTAVICANDRIALGAIDAFRRMGVACPRDVSVIGFNDNPFLDLIPPRLTTIRVDTFALGALAAGLLIRMITETEPDIADVTVLPVRLVARDSVAPLATD